MKKPKNVQKNIVQVQGQTGVTAFLPAIGAAVTLQGVNLARTAGLSTGSTAASGPTVPVVRRELTPGTGDIVYWGEGNNFPQLVTQLIEQNTIIPRSLADIAALWIGKGIKATATDDDGDEQMVDDAEIRAFLTSRHTKRFLIDAAKAMATWWNVFPELILSKDRQKIVQLHCLKTAFCRWGRMDEQTGELNRVYVSANWPSATADDPKTVRVPALNPMRYDLVEWLRAAKDYKYVYPLSFPSEDRSYYQLAAWDSARSSGWLDVLKAIPEFKKAAMANQMTLRYHIEVPNDYWGRVYGDKYDKADFDGKMSIRDEFLTSMLDRLTNVQNANKGILTESWVDHAKNQHKVVVNVLDDKHKEGKYNEDYSEGASYLLFALGVDPTLFGYHSGKEGGRSGGSDKREALDIFLAKADPFRGRILEIIQFAAEYNGWYSRYPRLTLRWRDTKLETKDKGATTSEKNTPT